MRHFLSVFLRFLLGWLAALFVLCIVSVVKYWDVLVSNLADSANIAIEGGMSIFITVFGLVILMRSIFR